MIFGEFLARLLVRHRRIAVGAARQSTDSCALDPVGGEVAAKLRQTAISPTARVCEHRVTSAVIVYGAAEVEVDRFFDRCGADGETLRRLAMTWRMRAAVIVVAAGAVE
ncbi:hypothetical protein [Nocardia gipuzkoensis]